MTRILKTFVATAACAGLAVVACAAPATGGGQARGDKHNGDVAGQVGDRTITIAEVDALARQTNSELFQQLYTARREALDGLVADALLNKEAESRGINRQDLMEQEIEAKVPQVTDSDVQDFYNQNKGRMGDQTQEQVADRIRQFLDGQNRAAARNNLLDGLRPKYGVKIALEPPRVEVAIAADDPVRGPANAPVTLIEFSEFQCPFCSRVGPTVKQVLETYGDKVRLVFRDYPLPFHNNAHGASEAAQCAHDQGRFWEYHDKLFANQQALAAENLKQYATDLGLDIAKFNECFESGRYKDRVDQDIAQGSSAGVRGTPAFFINGRFLSGAQPFEAFKTIIDEELERAAR